MRRSLSFLSVVVLTWLPSPYLLCDVEREEVERERGKDEEAEARPELDGRGPGRDGLSPKSVLEEGQENLEEIRRLLEQAQTGLSSGKTGAGTQGKQREAIRIIDELIEKLGKAAQQASSGGGGGGQDRPSSGGAGQEQKGQSQGSGEKQRTAGERQQQDQVGSARPEGQGEERQGEQEESRGEVPNDRVEEGRVDPSEGTDAERRRDRRRERWGFLPPKVREEMMSATAKEPPAEYRELIERYYRRISDFYERRSRRGR